MTIRIDDDKKLTADEAWALVTGEGEEETALDDEPVHEDPVAHDEHAGRLWDDQEDVEALVIGPPAPTASAAPAEDESPAKVLALKIQGIKCEPEDQKCREELQGLIAERRRLVPLLQLAGTMNTFNLMDLAGAPVERRANSLGISVDWLSKVQDNGLRFLVGAYFRGYRDNMAAGARIGFGADVTNWLSVKMPFGLGWLKARGADDDAGGVPIELAGSGINADQTAYTMAPHSVDMTMHAASLSIDPEVSFVIHRWHIGGGKTLSLGAFLAISAGLYLGSLRDDDCSYAYDPTEGGLEVRPTGQGSYEFSGQGALSSRCRDGDTAFGSLFGASTGLSLEVGF